MSELLGVRRGAHARQVLFRSYSGAVLAQTHHILENGDGVFIDTSSGDPTSAEKALAYCPNRLAVNPVTRPNLCLALEKR
jgi:hypothetical protein